MTRGSDFRVRTDEHRVTRSGRPFRRVLRSVPYAAGEGGSRTDRDTGRALCGEGEAVADDLTGARRRPRRRRASVRSSMRLRARDSGSPGGTRRPFPPSKTTSGVPPTAVATAGTPAASDSRAATGRPSVYEGRVNTSKCGTARWTSARKPANTKRPVRPSAATRAGELERRGPSPKWTNAASGTAQEHRGAAASTRTPKPFPGSAGPRRPRPGVGASRTKRPGGRARRGRGRQTSSGRRRCG